MYGRKMHKQRCPVRELRKVQPQDTQWRWETLFTAKDQGTGHRGGGQETGNSVCKVAKHELASESFAPV